MPLNLVVFTILALLLFPASLLAGSLRASINDPRVSVHLRSALSAAAAVENVATELQTNSVRPEMEIVSGGPDYHWATPDSRVLLVVEGNVDLSQLSSLNGEVNTSAGGVTTLLAPLSSVPDILALDGIRGLEMEQPVELCTDISTLATNAKALWGGPPPNYAATGQTGENVVIGIVDTGLDVTHQDLRTSAGSRVKFGWDQTITTGQKPAGFTYGSEYTQAQINAGSYPGLDEVGHGTHITGVAAGNGRATGGGVPQFTYTGMAPEADIVFVKLMANPNGTYTDARIIDGVNYVFQKAAALNKPAVVLLAVNKMTGPHDGSDPMDIALTALTGPGKILVTAAGNEYGRARHAEWTASTSQPAGSMTVNVPTYAASSNASDHFLVEAWYDAGENATVSVTTPAGLIVGPVLRGTQLTLNTPSGVVNIKNGVTTSANGSYKVEFNITRGSLTYPAVAAGTWSLNYLAVTNPYFRVDAWLTSWILGSGAATFVNGKTESRLIGSPSTAQGAISVSSYTTKRTWTDISGAARSYYYAVMNQVANYASSGPRRDGALVPHITAPGYGVAGALSNTALSVVSSAYRLQDGVHYVNSGTSVAAAHVAGGVALLLQQARNLTHDQIVNQIQTSATVDSYTGQVPNPRWGAGKLYLQPLAAAAVGDQAFTSQIGFRVSPNPSRGPAIFTFNVPLDAASSRSMAAELVIYDVSGREVSRVARTVTGGPTEFVWDGMTNGGDEAAAGMYWGRLNLDGQHATARIVRTK
ncbi:MAG TPA: S8 family serine peptidase [Candidatus Eisenbacteria bacterium]